MKKTILGFVVGIFVALLCFSVYVFKPRNPNVQPQVKNSPAASTSLVSPDGSHSLSLEKEYDAASGFYLTQSLVLTDVRSGSRTTLDTFAVSREDAPKVYFTEATKEDPNLYCNGIPVSFDKFAPERWVSNDIVLSTRFFDGSECAGQGRETVAYSASGKKLFTPVAICAKNAGFAVVERTGNYIPVYSYFEYDPVSGSKTSALQQSFKSVGTPGRIGGS